MFECIRGGSIAGLMAVAFFVAACDRHEREQGGVHARGGPPISTVAAQFTTVAAVSNVAEVAPRSGRGPDGAELYGRVCGACHQSNGQGVPGAFPPLDASPYVTGPNVERMASIMLYGLIGPIDVKGAIFNSAMTAQGPLLKDDELAAVATYVRSSWSNKAGPVEAAVFTKMRDKWGARGPFNISELGEEK